MPIITISRQFGSLGTVIAEMLKEELKLDSLGRIKIREELVNKYGVSLKNVQKYDEKKPAFWDVFSSDKDRYLHFMKTEVYECAKKGNCIMIGRGAQVLLQDVPSTLHVRIIAPRELRIERIKQRYNYNDKLGEHMIRHSDHDRTGFYKFFFHVNWEDPGLYDLVINTRTFSVENAVCLIKGTIDMLGIREKGAEAERKLADLCLGQEVITQIAYKEKLPIEFLETNVENGVVTLKGSTSTSDNRERCETIARQVPGVKDVITEVYFVPSKDLQT